nr:PAS domain S-box protein [Acidobacteriota bacterium]
GAERFFGYTEEEIIGQNAAILFTPEDRERGAPEQELRTAAAAGRAEDERWHLRKDGSRFWVSGLTMALKDDDENLRGFVKVGRDFTERRQAEETLRKAHAELDSRVKERTHELVTANILLKDEIAERKRVEEDSRKFKFISDNASDAHFLCDHNGRIVYANRVACEQLGYTQEEMLRLTIPELDPVYLHDRVMKFFERAKKERVPPFEAIHKRKDGSIFPVEVTSTYLEFEDKAFLFSAVRDITKRKHAEEALRESEERLRLIFEGIKDYAVYLLDAEGYITSWNEGATRLKGYRAEEIIGQHDSVCFTPEDVARGKPANALAQAAAKGRHEEEQLAVRKDGTRFWANVLLTALRDEEGLLRGFVSFTRDITERRQMEVALRESEEKYRTLFNSNLDGFGYFNLKGEFLDANPAYLTMLGYSFEELKMKIYQDFTPVKWADFEADIVKNQILARGYSDEYEKEYIRKDGTIFPVNIRAWRVDDEAGNPIGMSGIARDITERKRAEHRQVIQHDVTRILAESSALDEAIPQILKAICVGLEWQTCEFWDRDRDANVLRCVANWRAVEDEYAEFVASCFVMTFEQGVGLAGEVWASIEPVWIEDLATYPKFRRGEIAAREGLHTALGLPILLGTDVLGVLSFFSRECRERDEQMIEMLAMIGSQIGQFIE